MATKLTEEQINSDSMRCVKSCGTLLMKPDNSFLLLRHSDRYDLPKGHMENGETELDTAIRETQEETGILSSMYDIDPNFRFEHVYYPKYARFGGKTVRKTIVVFLGRLKSNSVEVTTTEHGAFEWVSWQSPPLPKETKTIDNLISKIHDHINK